MYIPTHLKLLGLSLLLCTLCIWSCDTEEDPENCAPSSDLSISGYDSASHTLSLQWLSVQDVEEYLMTYENDLGDSLNLLTSSSSISMALSQVAIDHRFTILTSCPDGRYSIGPSIGFQSPAPLDCGPPENVMAVFENDSTVVLSWTNPPGVEDVFVSAEADGILVGESISDNSASFVVPTGTTMMDFSLSSNCTGGGMGGVAVLSIIVTEDDVEGACLNPLQRFRGAYMIKVVKNDPAYPKYYRGAGDFCIGECGRYGNCR